MPASLANSLGVRLPPASSAGTDVDEKLGGPFCQRLPAAEEDPGVSVGTKPEGIGGAAGLGAERSPLEASKGDFVATGLPSFSLPVKEEGGRMEDSEGDRLPAAESASEDSFNSGCLSIHASSVFTCNAGGGAAEADLDVVVSCKRLPAAEDDPARIGGALKPSCKRLPAAEPERAEATEPEAEIKVDFFLGGMISAGCNSYG